LQLDAFYFQPVICEYLTGARTKDQCFIQDAITQLITYDQVNTHPF